jgi:hypothetical protein
MPVSMKTSDDLFELIHSLTKGEKQKFKLHAKKGTKGPASKSVILFDIYESIKVYDKEKIIKKVRTAGLEKHFTITRSRLYTSILEAVSSSEVANRKRQLFETLIYSDFLREKNLFEQERKILSKGIDLSFDHDLFSYSAAVLSDYKNTYILSPNNYDRIVELNRKIQTALSHAEEELFYNSLHNKMAWLISSLGHVKSKQMLGEINKVKKEFEKQQKKYENNTQNTALKESVFAAIAFLENKSVLALHYLDRQAVVMEKDLQKIKQQPSSLANVYLRKIIMHASIGQVKEAEKEIEKIDRLLNEKLKHDLTPAIQRAFLLPKMQLSHVYLVNKQFERGILKMEQLALHKQPEFAATSFKMKEVYWIGLVQLYLLNGNNRKALQASAWFNSQESPGDIVHRHFYLKLMLVIIHYELENHDMVESVCNAITYRYKKLLKTLEFETSFIRFARTKLTGKASLDDFKKFTDHNLHLLLPEIKRNYFDFGLWLGAKCSGLTLSQYVLSQ